MTEGVTQLEKCPECLGEGRLYTDTQNELGPDGGVSCGFCHGKGSVTKLRKRRQFRAGLSRGAARSCFSRASHCNGFCISWASHSSALPILSVELGSSCRYLVLRHFLSQAMRVEFLTRTANESSVSDFSA